ncbi:MAG: cyclase family protein [Desulfobacterales bacterium]|nr:MAG: cyclase family protein [Desulfobacterales bacterium]
MFLELSYAYSETMPIYPGLPEESFEPHKRIMNGDEGNTTLIKHFLHNGTHVDAPFHFDAQGLPIDKVPIEDFIYEHPVVIKKKLNKSELLRAEDIKAYGDVLQSADLLLFYTGYCELRGDTVAYTDDFPAVSEEAAQFIRDELLNVKAVAIDTLSIESATRGPQENFKVHRTFLNSQLSSNRPLLVYEDVNIGKIIGRTVKRIYAFPLRLQGLDASPVNMVAEVVN